MAISSLITHACTYYPTCGHLEKVLKLSLPISLVYTLSSKDGTEMIKNVYAGDNNSLMRQHVCVAKLLASQSPSRCACRVLVIVQQ